MGNIVVGEYYKSKEERCIIKIDTIVDYFGEKWCETTLFKGEGISHIKFPMESYFAQSLEKIDNFAAELFKFFNLENIKSDKEEKVPKTYTSEDIVNACAKIIEKTDCFGTGIADAIDSICYEIISELERGDDE